jgi:signal peptide peptidase SppA
MSFKSAVIELVQESFWAILPKYLDTIHQILFAKFSGDGIDIKEIENRLGRPLDNKALLPTIHYYDVQNGAFLEEEEGGASSENNVKSIAVIPINGTLAKRLNLFQAISGGTSIGMLMDRTEALIDNDEIDGIVLDIDSPGGTVAGTKEFADLIQSGREKKPITTYVNSLAASAAYWIGSSSDKLLLSSETAQVGSIGVLAAHYDYSEADKKAGIKKTFIYAGKYKTVGNDAEPLSNEAKKIIQKRIDELYTIFVDNVAKNRGVDTNIVIEKWANGLTFLGEEAVKMGLADGIENLKGTIALTAQMVDDRKSIEDEYEKAEPVEIDQ